MWYDFKGNYIMYLKPLYKRLGRLAQRQSWPLFTEAQQEHVNIIFQNLLYFYKKKSGQKMIHRHLCRPQKQLRLLKNTAY